MYWSLKHANIIYNETNIWSRSCWSPCIAVMRRRLESEDVMSIDEWNRKLEKATTSPYNNIIPYYNRNVKIEKYFLSAVNRRENAALEISSNSGRDGIPASAWQWKYHACVRWWEKLLSLPIKMPEVTAKSRESAHSYKNRETNAYGRAS